MQIHTYIYIYIYLSLSHTYNNVFFILLAGTLFSYIIISYFHTYICCVLYFVIWFLTFVQVMVTFYIFIVTCRTIFNMHCFFFGFDIHGDDDFVPHDSNMLYIDSSVWRNLNIFMVVAKLFLPCLSKSTYYYYFFFTKSTYLSMCWSKGLQSGCELKSWHGQV